MSLALKIHNGLKEWLEKSRTQRKKKIRETVDGVKQHHFTGEPGEVPVIQKVKSPSPRTVPNKFGMGGKNSPAIRKAKG